MGSKAPPPPDMTESIAMTKEIADDQLAFQKQMFGEYEKWQDRSWDLYQETQGLQNTIAREQWKLGQEDRKRWEEQFRPLEDQAIDRIAELEDPRYQALQRARAQAGVQQSFDAQRENAMQRMSAMGVDPSQVRSGALDTNARNQMAAQQAAAGNMQDNISQQQADNMRGSMINVGRGQQSFAASQMGAAAGTNQSQMGMMGQAAGMGSTQLGTGMQAGQNAMSGANQMAGIQNMQYGNQLSAANFNSQNSGIAAATGLVGTVAGAASTFMPGMAEGGVAGQDEAPVAAPSDTVVAALTPGEFVVPKDVVEWKGQEFFEKLQMKSRQDKEQGIQASAPKTQGVPA